MEMKAIKSLDAVHETLGLMYLAYHPEHRTPEWFLNQVQNTSAVRQIYAQFQPVFDQYVAVFEEHMEKSEQDGFFFLEQKHSELLNLLQSALSLNPDWLKGVASITDEELFQAVADLWDETSFNSVQEAISYLQDSLMSPELCWKWTLILSQPRQYIGWLVDIYQRNVKAYEKALAAVFSEVKPLLERFHIPTGEFIEGISCFLEDASCYPTLCQPLTFRMYSASVGVAYCGLYLYENLDQILSVSKSPEVVVELLKTIGDKRKFEILSALKTGSKYNLELAKELGISTATASHHMSALLSGGFVSVDKRDGKVFYSLRNEGLAELADSLEALFKL